MCAIYALANSAARATLSPRIRAVGWETLEHTPPGEHAAGVPRAEAQWVGRGAHGPARGELYTWLSAVA
eukprot:422671-Prymnesium_polylepis.1